MNDTEIQRSVVKALGRLGDDVSRVEVSVIQGDVILRGSVKSWFEADEIERTAWQVPHITNVDNRLVYPEGGETAEAQELP